MNVGVAAHITAASPDGPRYDPSLTSEQRRHHSNGIWLCQNHGKLVDSDEEHFSVEMLRGWKRGAERRAFDAIVGRGGDHAQPAEAAELETAVQELIERLGLPVEDDLDSVLARLLRAAAADLTGFTRMPGWPRHPVTLNLRIAEGGSRRAFRVSGLAAATEAFNEFTVIAPPGTGKTTTLLQVSGAIVSGGRAVALFVPLGDWSTQAEPLLGSVVRRPAFQGIQEQHLVLLAHHGRLVLALDGWNELDSISRKRAAAEIRELQRNFPQLSVIISTRRQALDVPIGGQAVEVDILTEDQQLEIALASRGADGEALLDHAWRTPGVRELISIPLYLTALLTHAPGSGLPTTKEEVLRLFVAEHEIGEKAAALQNALFGFHPQMLTALAAEATHAANTAISVTRARAVVRQVEDGLAATGQIASAPQPAMVLDVLVDQHMLVRSDSDAAALSFQHQQFQEWYASFETERVMRRAAAAGDEAALRRLRVDILDRRAWEESILFACERVSRVDAAGASVIAATVLEALSIDPMLAAEIIYRSSAAVWEQIGDAIFAFVGRWHSPGTVDRAVRFMITSGRPEFDSQIWPLIENPDNQIHLSALRAARRFRPSVLGRDAAARLAAIPQATREHVLAELAMRGGIDGIALATGIARTDPSPDVQLAVIEGLLFRRANRHAMELLGAAAQEVWPRLARKGYIEEITDPAAAARLRAERQRLLNEASPLNRIELLRHTTAPTQADGEQIARAIADPNFPAADQHGSSTMHSAFQRYPNEVASGLMCRLEAGLPVPFDAEDMLTGVDTVDDGPIAQLAANLSLRGNLGRVAASVVGPNTVAGLIDTFVGLADKMKDAPGETRAALDEEYHLVRDRIASTRASSFVEAISSRSATDRPRMIGRLAELVRAHGSDDVRERPLISESLRLLPLIDCVHRWVEAVLALPDGKRHDLAEVALAIGRIGHPELVPDLKLLLDEELLRWRQARQARVAAAGRATIDVRSDASTRWTNHYQEAFSRIGGELVIRVMADYLEDEDFGFDAACVLKTVWDRAQNASEPNPFRHWPDFSGVRGRRAERREAAAAAASPLAEMIFAAIERLIQPGSGEKQQRLAIMLGRIGVAIPHGDRSIVIRALLALRQPIRTKRELLATLVLDGEIISADLVLDGIRAWIESARQNTWMFRDGLWDAQAWLELLPFTDRPQATIEGVELVNGALPNPHELERAVRALARAPDAAAESVLAELARRLPRLAGQHDWAEALIERDTVSAAIILIDLVLDGTLANAPGSTELWWISRQLAALTHGHPELLTEVLRRYESMTQPAALGLIERTLAEIGTAEATAALMRGYARNRKPFDGLLGQALHDAALDRQPAEGWVGAFELHPVPLTELRKELFEMLAGAAQEAALAAACLEAIDELRDDYGPAEFEPRHPDVASGRPWPLEVNAAARQS